MPERDFSFKYWCVESPAIIGERSLLIHPLEMNFINQDKTPDMSHFNSRYEEDLEIKVL